MNASLCGRAVPALLVLLAACGRDESASVEQVTLRAAHVAAAQRGASAAYRATPTAAGLRLANPAQGLRAELTAEGVAVVPVSGGAAWVFHASASRFGCEDELRALPSAAAEAHGNRVEYARGALREWYVNGPLGLEQGFTLPAPPWCARRGRVVIELGGGLDAVVSEDGQEARLHDASGQEALRYTDLRVVDAAGRLLPAELGRRPGGLSIRLDDAGAVYPVVVDPLIWAQVQELTPDDAMGAGIDAFFGGAVAVSGSTILVGAEDHEASDQGAAYVFIRSGGIWAEQQQFKAVDAQPNDRFGASVSLSGDTAILGAPGHQSDQGAAYVFVRSGGAWMQQQELTPWDGSQESLVGSAVAVDGDTAVVGSPNNQGFEPGAVYLFTRTSTTWTQQQQLADANAADGDLPGTSVAVSGDTVVVGAPGQAGAQGAAYVFVLSGGVWIEQQALSAGDGAPGDRFGTSVAVSGDTAVVGAPFRGGGQASAAYVFTRAGSTWTLQQELVPPAPLFAFGNSVALSGDTAIVGWLEGQGATPGAAYSFTRAGSLWTSQELVPGDTMPNDMFGLSVAVDGPTAVVGASNKAVYVFGLGSANGDACTSAAECASGSCTDGVCCVVPACPAPNTCQTAVSCQAGTGTCKGTAKPDGLACDDGDACTQPDTCLGGTCLGHAPKTCPPVDECHDFGSCDPVSAVCSSPVKPDGLHCTGGVCSAGICVPEVSGSSSSSGAGPVTPASHGCGCGVAGAPPGGGLAVGVALLMLARRRGRRGGASR